MAANSPIMQEVIKFGKSGGFILGVCNGFQILAETGLVPGVLLRNKELKFLSKRVQLNLVNKTSKFTAGITKQNLEVPIAHHDGNYFCDADTLKSIQDNDQIAFTYQDNPNGSIADIAGVLNKEKNILAMMPHPERAVDELVGGVDGRGIFESLAA